VLAAHVDENHAQTLPHVGRFVAAPLVDGLHRWQRAALEAAGPRLADRARAGRVREGHGDLRLEHVYFAGGDPAAVLAIDPIDFNRRLRCLDQGLDVAFLAMELEAAARPDLAAHFLSCFARASGDYGFYPLLDLFLSYRAWVRAKLACFVAADPGTPPEKASRKASEAARLFTLAASYQDPATRRPQVIAVGGLIGSGKTTLADALGRALALPVISSDATRKRLGGLHVHERGGPALYTDAFTDRTQTAMQDQAGEVLASGRGVILDATFRDPRARRAARALAHAAGRPFLFVELTCDEETLRARLRQRAASPGLSDAREDLLPRLLSEYQPPTELPPGERVRLDGRRGAEELAREVVAAVISEGRVPTRPSSAK
jgi:predicted kinase